MFWLNRRDHCKSTHDFGEICGINRWSYYLLIESFRHGTIFQVDHTTCLSSRVVFNHYARWFDRSWMGRQIGWISLPQPLPSSFFEMLSPCAGKRMRGWEAPIASRLRLFLFVYLELKWSFVLDFADAISWVVMWWGGDLSTPHQSSRRKFNVEKSVKRQTRQHKTTSGQDDSIPIHGTMKRA